MLETADAIASLFTRLIIEHTVLSGLGVSALGEYVLSNIQSYRLKRETDISTDANQFLIGASILNWWHLKEKRIDLLPTFLWHMLIVAENRSAVSS